MIYKTIRFILLLPTAIFIVPMLFFFNGNLEDFKNDLVNFYFWY